MATSDKPSTPPPPPRRAASASNPPSGESLSAERASDSSVIAEPPGEPPAAPAEPPATQAEPAARTDAPATDAKSPTTHAELPARADSPAGHAASPAPTEPPATHAASPAPTEPPATHAASPPAQAESAAALAAQVASELEDSPDSEELPTIVRSEPPLVAMMNLATQAEKAALHATGSASAMLPPPSPAGAPSLPKLTAPAPTPPPPPSALPPPSTPPAARAKSLPPSEDEPESATFVQRPNAGSETRSARDGLGAIGRDAQRTFEQAIEYLDTHDAWVPIRYRGRIRGSVLTLSGALVALAVVGGAAALVKATSSKAVSTPAPATAAVVETRAAPAVFAASPSPSVAAVKAPEKAVAAPLERPRVDSAPSSGPADEGALLLDSARSFAWQGRDAEAVTLIERALLRNPELRSDARVREVLLRTAHSDDRASSAATFALLEGPMGDAGAELMYEISIARVGKDSARKRAQGFLRSKQFAKNAALPLFIAVKLRQAKSCEDKHALLTLAAGGGKQTLDYLRELQAHTTCAPDDLVNCYPCLRADSRLTDAISAIEQRTKG